MRILILTASYGEKICHIENKFFSKKNKIHFVKFDKKNYPLPHLSSNRLKGKYPKMLPFEIFKNYDWYIWIDSKFIIRDELNIDEFFGDVKSEKILLCNHPHRNNIKEELKYMEYEMNNGNKYLLDRYNLEEIKKQTNNYLADKSFNDHKLFSMGFFAFHRDAKDLMVKWFNENLHSSLQDQISFPYLLTKSKLSYKTFNFNLLSNKHFIHISVMRRKPIRYMILLLGYFFQICKLRRISYKLKLFSLQ